MPSGHRVGLGVAARSTVRRGGAGLRRGLDRKRERESDGLLGGWLGSQERKRERKHWAGLAETTRLATNFPKVSYNFSAIISKVTYKKSVLQSKVAYKKSNLTKHNGKIKIQISISITHYGSRETTMSLLRNQQSTIPFAHIL